MGGIPAPRMIDLPGQAIYDHYFRKPKARLWIHNTYGNKEQMDVSIYLRQPAAMPFLEQLALQNCQGKILDIGAGAGSHTLVLQQQKFDVTALEISPAAAMVMQSRGVEKIVVEDIFTYQQNRYNTLLLLMNGIGLCATLNGLQQFLAHAKNLLLPGGKIIFDTSDVSYVYDVMPEAMPHYYGEIKYRYAYKKTMTPWFTWLYIDRHTLAKTIEPDWQMKILAEDDADQYLVQLLLK